MRNAWMGFVRVVGFTRKELVDILRQPRLIAILVFGPFGILLLFGLGYNNQPPALRTIFVAPQGSVYRDVVTQYTKSLSDWIHPEGFTADEQQAMADLHNGKVQVVVVFPNDPMTTVLAGKQAPIKVVHDQLDPIQQTAIGFATKLAVDQVNSAILAQIVGAGQQVIRPLAPARQVLAGAGTALGQAVQRADTGSVQALAQQVGQAASDADAVITATSSFFSQLQSGSSELGLLQQAHTELTDLQASAHDLQTGAAADQQAAASKVIDDVTKVDQLLGQLQTVDPSVLVQPFTGETVVATSKPVGITDYYAPGAVALLVQHLGITFAALSFVRDRGLGVFELLRIGPVTSGQTLTGKYVAYGLVGAFVAAALTTLVVFALNVPLVGKVSWVAIVLALVLLASLGLGFLVSLIAHTDGQAVQFSMIVLLASLFFGGFFLSLSQLRYPIEAISLILPVRYGINGLHDVMLRGTAPAATDLIGLVVLALIGAIGSWAMLRRQLSVL